MKQHKLTPYALLMITAGMSVTGYALAEEQLGTINVYTELDSSTKANHSEKKTAKIIQQELIQNNRDLVRYSPDVGVVDQGRHQKGFAIRGVEDNRVGISIDGVALPDSEENSLYKRYGNLNTSRQSIDPELARTIDIAKGADSFNQGSGNIGGGVNYRTLEPFDIVRNGRKFGALYRTGYASRNTEWVNTLGVAYAGEQAEALLLYSNRHGHEMKSAGGYTIPKDSNYTRSRGHSKQTPDDSTHNNHSYLAKFAYRFNDSHRVGISYSGSHNKNYIIEDSATTLSSAWREADDRAKRDTVNVFYEYLPNSKVISLVKVDLDYQKTQTAAYNYEGFRSKDDGGSSGYREPSDNNLRFFNTKFKRVNFRIDSQPFDLNMGSHTFSFKTSISERKFDILEQDSFYVDNDSDGVKEWNYSKDATMMYPVKTKNYKFSLLDKIVLTPEWKAHLGVRYDVAKHSQESLGGLACRNCRKADDAKFHNVSWTSGVEKTINDDWKVAYNIGTGFRMPNASEMYFDYRDNAAGAWLSNPNLKAEKSLTQNLNLLGKGHLGELSLNLHHSRYKDFLYEQETWEYYNYYGSMWRWRPVQQMQNIDSAKIYGVEFTGKLNLNEVTPMPNGWKLFGSLGYSKGSMSNGASLMSIQPVKAIIGLDYEQPEGKWGIFSRLTYLGATKAKNAKYLKTVERCVKEERVRNPYYDYYGIGEEFETKCTEEAHETALDTWKHLNSKAFVFDMFGFYKPTENITLRAGAYNLFNRKYHTWDTLRGLNNTGGKINSVGLRPNYTYGGYPGLQRYYQPGRNFAASVEIRF
ncbi:TonB-dependent hemoglobin/transferrin/lactoferrin family receptor [Haemophilus influenzae]|uniref:TonB-dependent hemoglobin/transferrin/lactoferrin family receptor n=1 Tax=Haemophilus influenzae TaxID=727 RepID=UPI000D0133D9|nr:TonB-dependent hemoglobin/transferrin/lactoferrin family receptor [Haemophilus influenzae]PRJ82168.1 Hemoglobin and hemoglobin-haptoglobin-binding protein A precursor [Haemophilus influenzae]